MGGETQKTVNFGGKLSFILSFLFLNTSIVATYIFISLTCTTTIIILEPCALNVEFQHFIQSYNISYCDFIKRLYFANTTKRKDRG
jgi:hypothetical protein